MGSALYLGVAWGRAERGLVRAHQVLAEHQQERDSWREQAQAALRGLGEAIDNQLTAWSLTPAEKETALLLLKGYSHKEIAHHTDRSERTVRQHAVSVYRKSGLSGRAELAAFFLEDLLLPGDESGRATGAADV
jgi:DNA-binding NarL/FixJ family response regulator